MRGDKPSHGSSSSTSSGLPMSVAVMAEHLLFTTAQVFPSISSLQLQYRGVLEDSSPDSRHWSRPARAFAATCRLSSTVMSGDIALVFGYKSDSRFCNLKWFFALNSVSLEPDGPTFRWSQTHDASQRCSLAVSVSLVEQFLALFNLQGYAVQHVALAVISLDLFALSNKANLPLPVYICYAPWRFP